MGFELTGHHATSGKYKILALALLIFIALKFFDLQVFLADMPKEFVQTQTTYAQVQATHQYFSPYFFKSTYRYTLTGIAPLFILQKLISPQFLFIILSVVIFILAWRLGGGAGLRPMGAIALAFFVAHFYNFFLIQFEDRAFAFLFFYIYLLWHLDEFLLAFRTGKWRPQFFISLLLLIFCWEQWLDLLPGILLFCWLARKYYRSPGLYYKTSALYLFCALFYLLLRFSLIGDLGELKREAEQAFIFSHHGIFYAVEDFVTGAIKFISTAFANLWPSLAPHPSVVASYKGPQIFTDVQDDFFLLPDYLYFNYLYNWYIYVGIWFAIFIWGVAKIFKNLKHMCQSDNATRYFTLVLILFSCLGLFSGFGHWFVRFRPYLSQPFYYNYKSIIGVVAMSLLWAFAFEQLWYRASFPFFKWSKTKLKTTRYLALMLILIMTYGGYHKAYIALNNIQVYDKFNSFRVPSHFSCRKNLRQEKCDGTL